MAVQVKTGDRPARRALAVEIGVLVLGGAIASFASPAAMAQARGETTLPAVKVKGERVQENVTVVDAQALEQTQAKDLRETFASEPGVEVGGGGAPIAQKIYVRGLEDALLDVSVDGARQNGFIYHHQGRFVLDPQLLKSVEVEKGTGAAPAGPGALAGALRLTTKDAADLLRPGQKFGFLVGGGHYSNEGSRGQATAYGKVGEALDLLASYSRTDVEDYEDGNGNVVTSSGSEQDTRLAKATWHIVPGHDLAFSYNGVAEEGVRYLRPNMIGFAPQNATLLPNDFERDTLSLAYRFSGVGAVPRSELVAWSDDNTVTRVVANRHYGEEVKARGFDARLESRIGAHRLQYGLNHSQQDAAAINPNKRFNPAFTNGATNRAAEEAGVTGIYLQDTLALGRQWVLGAGARYDSYDYTDNHSQEFRSKGFSPNASITYLPTDPLSIRMAYTEALRGVGLKETFLLDNGPGPNIYRNDASLRPEEARNVDLSTEYKGADWTLRGSVYQLVIDDFIQANFIAGQARRFNAGRLKSIGYELGANYSKDGFSGGFSVAHARPKLNGAPLSDGDFGAGVATGRSWKLNLDYTFPAWNIDLGWTSRYVESQDTVAGDNTAVRYTKDGYAVHDFHVTWMPMKDDTLRVRFAVKNLFDKFHYDQATYSFNSAQNKYIGFPEPGRDVRLDVSYKF